MKFCMTPLAFLSNTFLSSAQFIPQSPIATDAKCVRYKKWTLLFDAGWSPVTDNAKAFYND
jgi:hypothetical protein